MKEYKILTGIPLDCQKKLNQWRHEFFINIISMASEKFELCILLTREKKGL